MQKTNLIPSLILFTFIRTIVNTAHRMVYPFLAAFARGMGVDLVDLSYLFTARALIGAGGMLSASLTDRLGRKVGMLIGLGIFSLGAALVVFFPTFTGFALAVLLTAFGKYFLDISLIAWVGDRVDYQGRARILAVTEFGWSLAFILGIPLVGLLIARLGWDSPFLFLSLLGALSVFLLAIAIPRDRPHKRVDSQVPARQGFSSLLRSPAVPTIIAGLMLGLFNCASNETVNLLFGIWLEDSFGLQVVALGAASAVIGFSELGGEGLVAVFVDRLGKPKAVALGLVINSLAALALPVVGRSEAGALIGLFFFYISFEFTIVSSIPLMTEILPAARATVLSLNATGFLIGRALGSLVGPRLYSLGFGAVVAGALLFNLLALLALWQVKKRLNK